MTGSTGDGNANYRAALLDHVSDAIVSTDLRGTIRSWNPAAASLYGWTEDEVRGRGIAEVVDPGEPPATEAALAAARAGETWHGELAHRDRQGAGVSVLATASRFGDADEARSGLVLSLRDVTAFRRTAEALRRTGEQLWHAQRLESLGRLAAGMAHDFNNTLSVIYGSAQFLALDLAEDDPKRDDVKAIQEAVKSASALTQQLLAFGRGQSLRLEPLPVDAVLRDTERMLKRLVDADVRIETRPGADGALVNADRGKLQQVLVNLVVNARDAMPSGGTLGVETFIEDSPDAAPLPARVAVLRVSDTGVGMDEETRARLFEPFFTTKAEGKGTGLGLSVVYGIVGQLGGTVEVESSPGEGATFEIRLPLLTRAGASRQPTLPPPAESAQPAALGTLLVVEDDERVRASMVRLLRHRGYGVVEAGDPHEALALVAADPAAIDGVLTDVVMPEMSGPDLVAQVRRFAPGVPAVYVTGYREDEVGPAGEAGDPVVLKPFTVDALLDALERAASR